MPMPMTMPPIPLPNARMSSARRSPRLSFGHVVAPCPSPAKPGHGPKSDCRETECANASENRLLWEGGSIPRHGRYLLSGAMKSSPFSTLSEGLRHRPKRANQTDHPHRSLLPYGPLAGHVSGLSRLPGWPAIRRIAPSKAAMSLISVDATRTSFPPTVNLSGAARRHATGSYLGYR